MTPKEFYSKWHKKSLEMVSDLALAVDSTKNGGVSKVIMLRHLTEAYQGILEGYENPSMASEFDKEMAVDIVALINTLEGTSYTVNLPTD